MITLAKRRKRMRLLACLAAVTALIVAGCGGSDNGGGGGSSGGSGGSSSSGSGGGGGGGGSNSSSSSGGGGQTLSIGAPASGALKFTKKTLKAKAGTVTVKFDNAASVPHAFSVEGNGVDKDGKVVTKGSDTLTVKLKPGKYTFYCPVDGHRQAGMQGTLTVS
jgi:plastocyanin